jgi:hypothetical protein
MPSPDYPDRYLDALDALSGNHATALHLHAQYIDAMAECLRRVDARLDSDRLVARSVRARLAELRARRTVARPLAATTLLSPNLLTAVERECTTVVWTEVATADGPMCPIEMTQFDVGMRVTQIDACGHQFTSNALMRALQERPTCPMCRYNLQEGRPGSSVVV